VPRSLNLQAAANGDVSGAHMRDRGEEQRYLAIAELAVSMKTVTILQISGGIARCSSVGRSSFCSSLMPERAATRGRQQESLLRGCSSVSKCSKQHFGFDFGE
jgi:hypothetical protein